MTKRLINYLVKGYNLLISAGNLLQPLILLAFRIAWGLEFFVSGRGKLKNHSDIVDFFSSLHIPFPDLNAWFVAGLECVGGTLLILGLLSRPIGLILAVNMTVAYLAVDSDRALVFNMLKSQKDFDAFTAATPFFFWLTAVIVLGFGSGPISLDNLLAKTIFKRKAKDLIERTVQSPTPTPTPTQTPTQTPAQTPAQTTAQTPTQTPAQPSTKTQNPTQSPEANPPEGQGPG